MMMKKGFIIWGMSVVLLGGINLFALGLPHGHNALAQEETSRKKPKSTRAKVLRKSAFRQIEAAQKLLAKENYADALNLLEAMQQNEKYNLYEKAIARQSMGFAYAAQEQYAEALLQFEHALASDALPPRVANDIRYGMAQLYLAEAQNEKALSLLELWFANIEGTPKADAYALLAQINLTLADLAATETAIMQALTLTDQPKQSWIRIYLSVLLQQNRFQAARPVLEEAVQKWPDVKPFWQQLIFVYYDAGEDALAFTAYQAMHVQNMLKSSPELVQMAQLYLYHGIPHKAARIMEAGFAAGTIAKNAKNYELLANAYMHGRDWQKAVAPLTKAADMSDTGTLYMRLGESYVQNENWGQAAAAFAQALDKGALKKEQDVWLLLGISYARIEKFDAAKRALQKARAFEDTARDALRWLTSIARKQAQLQATTAASTGGE